MIGPGFNMSDQNIKRKEFGTVPKQLGAPWQKISPPVPQIYPPAQSVSGQTVFGETQLNGRMQLTIHSISEKN